MWAVDSSHAHPRVRNSPISSSWLSGPSSSADLRLTSTKATAAWHDSKTGLRTRDKDDEVVLEPRGELANLHDVFDLQGDRITMLYWPEELMVVPR